MNKEAQILKWVCFDTEIRILFFHIKNPDFSLIEITPQFTQVLYLWHAFVKTPK